MSGELAGTRQRRGPKTGIRGFSTVELLVAASVLLITSVGVLQTLTALTRQSELHRREIVAHSVVRSSVGYLRDIGYDSIVASGSSQLAQAIATEYQDQLLRLGTGVAVGVTFTEILPGSLLEATTSITWSVRGSSQSEQLATRIARGGPL